MGPIHDRDYFETFVRPLLRGDIEYAGHLDVADVADIVGHSAVTLVTPAWTEPFGLVVTESLACGTPVAAFDRGAIRELLDDRTGRLAAPGAVDDLATAMVAAAGLRRSDCRARAEAHFSAPAMTTRYESWFEELLAGSAA
jgi:glycosyltransferase involved in cell wall biosynthesis